MEALMTYGVPGPQGPAGATGSRGPQGPPGPVGPGGIKVYFSNANIPTSYSGATNAVLIGYNERRSSNIYPDTALIIAGKSLSFTNSNLDTTYLTVSSSGFTLSTSMSVSWILVL